LKLGKFVEQEMSEKFRSKIMNNKIKRKGSLFVWLLVLVVLAAFAVGEAGEGDVAGGGSDSVSGIEVNVGEGGQEALVGEATILSINFRKDMKIVDALRLLGAKYHKNIIPSPKVNGVITVASLYDVTFTEVMDAILGHDFKYEQEGNFIRVYTAEEYATIKTSAERLTYKVFTLYYISASEVRKLIAPVLSTSSKVDATSAAVTGIPTSDTIGKDTSGGDTMALNDRIVVYDYPENIAKAEEIIASVDVRPKQVLIEATIMSATLTEGMQFGIDWQTLNGTVTELSDITRDTSKYFGSTGNSGVTSGDLSLSSGLKVGFAISNVATFIEAIEGMTDVTVLANPKILAINKQLGQVYIGRKVAYVSQETISDGGTSTAQVEFLDTGTKLSFRPYIGNDGYIRIDIHPKDSSAEVSDIAGVQAPDETSAELVTNIMVKDGQTIVIGGLFRDQVQTKKEQIPLLGDIPLLGALFGGKADYVKREEVMILLTPHIINEPSEVDGHVRAADVRRKRVGANDELFSQSRARIAEDHYTSAAKYYLDGDTDSALYELEAALSIRPGYLEALRLKERIIGQTDPASKEKMDRIVLEKVEREAASKWRSR